MIQQRDRFRIEICGIMGAGKTTLANTFANFGIYTINESYKANPFWETYYKNREKYVFETTTTFLLQHYHEIKKIPFETRNIACDYALTQDYAYASMALDRKKMAVYHDLHREILDEVALPNLVVYVKCDIKKALDRIQTRGREVEQSLTYDVLEHLQQSIDESLVLLEGVPVVLFDTTEIEFSNGIYADEAAIVKSIIPNLEI